MDSLVVDQGEFYDGEEESDDRRNEQSFKRAAVDSADVNSTKKPKIDVGHLCVEVHEKIANNCG